MIKNLSKIFAYLRQTKQKCAKKLRNEKLHIVYSAQYNITLVRFKSKVNIWRLCAQNCQPNLKKTTHYSIFIM